MQHQKKISDNKTEVSAANINRESSSVQLKDNRKSSAIQQKLSEKTTNQESGFTPIQRKKNNTGLPDNLKSGIENLSGHSMGDVKVHYNSDKPAQLNAHAYAQGTNIHVASGQEKHLPHEAWHVVQQKQGRVKPTLQMKEKVSVNNDKGLEKEADVMGAKALQMKSSFHNNSVILSGAKNTTPNHLPIQRYSIKKAPENNRIYSQSNNGNMLTGMGSPNHDFYVEHTQAFPVMNTMIENSPLEIFGRAKEKLFGKNMLKAGLRYKTNRLVDEGRKEQIKRKDIKEDFFESKKTENVQLQYEHNVLPHIKAYRQLILNSAKHKIENIGLSKPVVSAIIGSLYELITSLNLFKKVFNSEIANKGDFYEDSKNLAHVGLELIRTVDHPLYETNLTKAKLITAKQTLLETWFDEEDRDNPNLINQIVYSIRDNLSTLISVFPNQPVDMMPFHQYNFNLEIIQNLFSPDNLVLFRACDVQASTLLGNKLTSQNAHQLKNYNAGQEGAFHYATKILQSGTDWVTLEHFAASVREREISGIGGSKFKNLDHTWQFIMQGQSQSTTPGISNEDKYFEIYTKIRYYLKGITQHETGTFDTARRDRVTDPTRKEHEWYVQLGDSSQLANIMGWRAFYKKIASEGEENELINFLERMDLPRSDGMDPLVHSKQSWDHLKK
ncbi:eCIS core domain-containing protein [Flavobacterium salmonis]|uniref:eCIS core domain-containing protein n=1 Tax=Flavobacterium salmonis TaxID=2654844 RepID=A0A6V6ZBE3_9FLAO|nr:DUF4157 domain-containing protein [Flavobacterium salmonis]CAD0009123.1 hypothetical protein FLAT13_04759 [Flavobacterium salmonis]